jgi:tryptophan synthase alpha chain
MNNTKPLAEAFAKGKALVAYLMAGDPDMPSSAELIMAAQEAGADLLEIGIPFSDPIAEGPVIQQASMRALEQGATLEKVFSMMEGIRPRMRVPMAFMTYLNPVFVYGYDRFFARCNACGVSGLIIPDMPFEEQGEIKAVARSYGIEVVSLIAPTSGPERIAKIAQNAEGFVYLVSSMGVTGMRSEITTDIPAMVKAIRAATSIPVAVGFGISSPEQAARYAAYADGAIVGSALVRLVAEHGRDAKEPLQRTIRSLKRAILP